MDCPLFQKQAEDLFTQSHRLFENLSTSAEILFTGIKVIDLIEPYSKGVRLVLLVVQVWVRHY